MEQIYIPERFKREVALHIIKQLLRQNIGRIPLLLGIHGKPGDGKTFQCEYVLNEIGTKSFLISGGQLESNDAGEPARLLRETYLAAGRSIDKGECGSAAVLINDIDTGLGDWGTLVQTTVNRQTVYGELMHLCDYPNLVDGRKTRRVPIIITGNDFTKLYEPLVRAGRMNSFQWEMTKEERKRIVCTIFPEITETENSELVDILETEATQVDSQATVLTVAFYAHLRTVIFDEVLWDTVSKLGLAQAIQIISTGREPALSSDVKLSSLLKMGQQLIEAGQLANHLRRN